RSRALSAATARRTTSRFSCDIAYVSRSGVVGPSDIGPAVSRLRPLVASLRRLESARRHACEGQPRMTAFSTRRKAFAWRLRVLPCLNGGGVEAGTLVAVRRLDYRARRERVASASTAARMAAMRVSCEPGSASPSTPDKE